MNFILKVYPLYVRVLGFVVIFNRKDYLVYYHLIYVSPNLPSPTTNNSKNFMGCILSIKYIVFTELLSL